MPELSALRLNLLRLGYAIMAGGIAIYIWPSMFSHRPDWPLMNSVVASMMTAMSLLALLGLRYPVQLLPLLLFELTWKTIWLAAIALPLWAAGLMEPRTAQTVFECGLMVILIPLIPWGHVFRSYAMQPATRWRNALAK
jgi:hypothetical protein